MVQTLVWHVTPESNIEEIQEDGLQPSSCTARPMRLVDGSYEQLEEGIYVTGKRRTAEKYAEIALHDVRHEMCNDERFALFKARVDRSRLWSDPEDAGGLTAYICEDEIEDPELVTVGVLKDPAGDFSFDVCF